MNQGRVAPPPPRAASGAAAGSAPSGSARLTAIRFGEFLFQRELISEEQLLEALGDHWSNGGNIGAAICRHGFLEPEEVERQASLYHSVDTIEV